MDFARVIDTEYRTRVRCKNVSPNSDVDAPGVVIARYIGRLLTSVAVEIGERARLLLNNIDKLTPQAVVAAIQDGRVEPVFRDGPLFKTLGTLYSRIHGVKGHTTDASPKSHQ